MKKMLIAAAIMLVILTAAACGKKETSSEEIPTGMTEETSAMVMVNGDADFSGTLGFQIDTSAIPVPGMARFIVDEKIAQMRFSIEKEDTEPVDILFRATVQEDRKDSLSEYTDGTAEPVSLTVAGIPVTQMDIETDELARHQYFFEKDGIYCFLAVTGELENEEFEALFTEFYNAVSK